MVGLPDLDERASAHFTYRDICHCGETWRRLQVDNRPRELETFQAIARLCADVLEPLVQEFGHLELAYGFAGAELTKAIRGRISPRLDQHAGHEKLRSGAPICARLGQAVDVQVEGVPSIRVACFIVETTRFDRLYLYGERRPLHVSCGPTECRAIVAMRRTASPIGSSPPQSQRPQETAGIVAQRHPSQVNPAKRAASAMSAPVARMPSASRPIVRA